MARGKHTCRILKEIRSRIAEANGIELITSECHYKGDCSGTCPKCEEEVRYLEEKLHARSLAGRAIVLAGISAGILLTSGCGSTSDKKVDEGINSVTESSEKSNYDYGGDNKSNIRGQMPYKRYKN